MTEMSNRKRASNDQLPTILRLVPIPPELAPKIYSLGACSEQAKIMWRINKKLVISCFFALTSCSKRHFAR